MVSLWFLLFSRSIARPLDDPFFLGIAMDTPSFRRKPESSVKMDFLIWLDHRIAARGDDLKALSSSDIHPWPTVVTPNQPSSSISPIAAKNHARRLEQNIKIEQ